MLGDFNTGPNAPCKRSRVAQGMHIRRRRPTPNAHLMRVFGCYGRHSPEGSPSPASSRSVRLGPRPNHPAASDSGREIPRHHPEPFAGNTENRKTARIATFLRLGTVTLSSISNIGVKAQVISRATTRFRFTGTEKSPQSKKSCKNIRIFVFATGEQPRQSRSAKTIQ